MRRPTFFLVGVPKAGTTALYDALQRHPEVFMCPHKEPNLFAAPEKPSPIQTLDAYRALFAGATDAHRAVGDASTDHFHHPEAPRRILDFAPDARAVVVLRHPAERAYSHYAMLVRAGAMPQRPYLSVLREAERSGAPLYRTYGTGIRQSLYADALARYQQLFGDRLRVYMHDDLRTDPDALLADLLAFVGADASIRPTLERRNASSQPRNPRLHRLLREQNVFRTSATALLPQRARRAVSAWAHRRNQAPLPPLGAEARALLGALFRPDVEQTAALLGRDLNPWMT